MNTQLPEEVARAWEEREGPIVLTTVDAGGMPNSIYATVVKRIADGRLAVADNYFDKTAANLRGGSRASILFMTKGRKAYQIKGAVEYAGSGPLHEEMLTWADAKHPRKGVAVLSPHEAFCGARRLMP